MLNLKKKKLLSVVVIILLNLASICSVNLLFQRNINVHPINNKDEAKNPVALKNSYINYFIIGTKIYCVDYHTIDVYDFSEPTKTKLLKKIPYPTYDYPNPLESKVLFEKDGKFVILIYNTTRASDNLNITLDFTFNICEVKNLKLEIVSSKTFYFELGYRINFNYYYEDNLLYMVLSDRYRTSIPDEYNSKRQLIIYNFTILTDPEIISSEILNVHFYHTYIYQMTKKDEFLYNLAYDYDSNEADFYLEIVNVTIKEEHYKILEYKLNFDYVWYWQPRNLVFYMDYLMVTSWPGITLINCSNLLNPSVIYIQINCTYNTNHFILQEDIVYTLNGHYSGSGSIDVFNVTNITNWTKLSSYTPERQGEGLFADGEIIENKIIAIRYSEYADRRIFILNIENPNSLERIFPTGIKIGGNLSNIEIIFVTIVILTFTGCSLALIRRKKKRDLKRVVKR